LPGAPGETETFADPPDQRRLKQDRKVGWYRYWAACGPGKCAYKVAMVAVALRVLPPAFQSLVILGATGL
jgi:hypothetical protein